MYRNFECSLIFGIDIFLKIFGYDFFLFCGLGFIEM